MVPTLKFDSWRADFISTRSLCVRPTKLCAPEPLTEEDWLASSVASETWC